MRFGDAAELGLPLTVENSVIDVAASGIRAVAGLRGDEVNVGRGSGGPVRIEHGKYRPIVLLAPNDRGVDLLAGHVGQLSVQELLRDRAAFALQVRIEPAAGHPLQFAEEPVVELPVRFPVLSSPEA